MGGIIDLMTIQNIPPDADKQVNFYFCLSVTPLALCRGTRPPQWLLCVSVVR
ncbi:hypothetical protein IQ243_23385 [Nostocales cyanobacterium LEGE 11386]|nr:hypothetical protein [Nostocales cyanobacterium LEGE 11386]